MVDKTTRKSIAKSEKIVDAIKKIKGIEKAKKTKQAEISVENIVEELSKRKSDEISEK